MTTPQEELLPSTRRALLHRIAVAQAEGRAPSLVAAVVRDGRPVWHGARTSVDGHGPDETVQYRIGSSTKTFTAVLVLRLRDEGLLDLGDPLEKHLPGTGAGEATIAYLLAHTGGLAAESPAPWWERTPGSLRPEVSDVLGEQPLLHPVGRRFHYSNPGYTVLGALVEKLRAAPWEEVLRREVLEPLGLDRTSGHPQAPHAGGWAVHPWADVMLPEPAEDLGRMAPAGQLWSTTGDLARFAAFLAQGDDRVLSAETVREMRTPAAPAEAADVVDGVTYGLGLQIQHRYGRLLVGHSGSLPGFLANLTLSVEDDVAAVVLANCTSGPLLSAVGADLVRIVAEAEPRIPEPWRPARSRRSGAGVGGAVVLGNTRVRPAAGGRGCLVGAAVGKWSPLAFQGERRRYVDRTGGLLRRRAPEGRTAPGRDPEPSGPRVVRVHASAVRRGGFRARWGGSGRLAGDRLDARVQQTRCFT